MENKSKKKINTTVLSVKELKALGHEVVDIKNQIEIANQAMDAIAMVRKLDQAIYAFKAQQFLEKAYEQNQSLVDKLDKIAFLLMENDNQTEIEAIK